MLFNSLEFLLFFPLVLMIYYLIPIRYRYLWLLFASYFFYMCWNVRYILLLMTSTVVTFISGLLIEKVKQSEEDDAKKNKSKKMIVFFCAFINLTILFYFKYANFAIDMLTHIFGLLNIQLNIPSVDVLLPVGISFYTFQALSYTVDVYRDEIKAEKNIFRYALFVSFFPQLVAGPIERSKNLLRQLEDPKPFNYEKARDGFLLMLWGYFVKMAVADRISIFVNVVYGDPKTYPGFLLVMATVLFAMQIYCDFYGYSTIAVGAAKFLGVDLMENFNAPYLSFSIAEFWRKWHISLTSWFRDYLYIPLGGNRKGKLRKHLNIMIVFLVSGLWHGADLTYVIWGALNGFYQVIGDLLRPVRNKLIEVMHVNRDSYLHKGLQLLVTFTLVCFSWIFFRAENLNKAIEVISSIFSVHNFIDVLKNRSFYYCELDFYNFWFMFLAIFIVLFVDVCKNKNIVIRNHIIAQKDLIRWLIIALSICAILLFGVWGPAFDQSQFIYFQF